MASRCKQVFGNVLTQQLCPWRGSGGPMLGWIMQKPLRGPEERGCTAFRGGQIAAPVKFHQTRQTAAWPLPPLHTLQLRSVTLSSLPCVKARHVALISTSWREFARQSFNPREPKREVAPSDDAHIHNNQISIIGDGSIKPRRGVFCYYCLTCLRCWNFTELKITNLLGDNKSCHSASVEAKIGNSLIPRDLDIHVIFMRKSVRRSSFASKCFYFKTLSHFSKVSIDLCPHTRPVFGHDCSWCEMWVFFLNWGKSEVKDKLLWHLKEHSDLVKAYELGGWGGVWQERFLTQISTSNP